MPITQYTQDNNTQHPTRKLEDYCATAVVYIVGATTYTQKGPMRPGPIVCVSHGRRGAGGGAGGHGVTLPVRVTIKHGMSRLLRAFTASPPVTEV